MKNQRVIPFVGILTPYGDPRTFDLVYDGVTQGKVDKSPVFVIVETIPGAVSFAKFFREEFEGLKVEVLSDFEKEISRKKANIVFTTGKILLRILIKYIGSISDLTDFISHIFYFIPNRIPYELDSYMNLKLIDVSRSHLNLSIPKVTLFAVNSATIPKIGSTFTVFNKNSISRRPVEYELFGKVKDNLYEEIARWILRTHMESPGKTMLVIVPSEIEIDNISNLILQIRVQYLKIFNGFETNIEDIEVSPFLTRVIVVTNEILPLVTIPVDIVIDSYRDLVSGKTLSGLETTFVITTPKEVALNRATVLHRIPPYSGEGSDSNTAGVDLMMTSLDRFNGENFTPVQDISKYLLLLGKTSLHPLDVWTYDTFIHKNLIQLQTYGALNPDYRITSLGEFILDTSLSPGESAVLWNYLQEYWSLGRSCLPALLLTAMISLYSEIQSYFVYNLPHGSSGMEERKYKREKWDKFAGADDIETFLKVWFYLISDIGSFELGYEDIDIWCRENSMNSNKLYSVYEKTKDLKESLKKYGFECEKDIIEVREDIINLRKIYSKVYLLRKMKNIGSGVFQSTSDQQTYTLYRRNSVNTISITEPPEIVGVITKDNKYILVTALSR